MDLLNKFKTNLNKHTLTTILSKKIKKFFSNSNKSKYDSYYIEKAQNYLKKKFLSEIPDGSTVLDVPFGTGRFIEFYLKKNMSVYGIDISKDMLDIAREHLGDHYNQCNISVGSAEHLPFENDFFDLVVSCRFLTLIPMAMVKKVLS